MIHSGLLNKQMVLDAQEKSYPIYSGELSRMVGGKMHHITSSALRQVSKQPKPVKQFVGGSHSGGAISGGGSKLSKYV